MRFKPEKLSFAAEALLPTPGPSALGSPSESIGFAGECLNRGIAGTGSFL